MKWYERHYTIEDVEVALTGIFVESQIIISATIGGETLKQLYRKHVNMWAYQEVLAEDILHKYQGMIRKSEKQLPILVEKFKISKRI